MVIFHCAIAQDFTLCNHCASFSDTWYMGGQETGSAVEQNGPLQIVHQEPDGLEMANG